MILMNSIKIFIINLSLIVKIIVIIPMMNCVQGFPRAVRKDPTEIFSLMSHPFSRQLITVPTSLSEIAFERFSSRESVTPSVALGLVLSLRSSS